MLCFQVWDLGGQAMLRQTWHMYFVNTDGVILVIDSADPDRLDVAREELQKLLNSEELSDAAILVFANKQDVKGAITVLIEPPRNLRCILLQLLTRFILHSGITSTGSGSFRDTQSTFNQR